MDLFGEVTRYSKGKCRDSKRCTICGEIKPLWAFSRDAKNKDGLRFTCKDCDAIVQKQSRKKMRYISVEYKQCSDCGRVKPIEDFGVDKTKKDGHRSYCLACLRIRCQRQRKMNKTKILRRK